MTTYISKEQWLGTLLSEESREFFGQLIDFLWDQDIKVRLTKAGYFGIPIQRHWNDRELRIYLSDSYRAGGTFNFPRDTLRIGYGQDTPTEIKTALDPWIDDLHNRFQGQSRRAIARYEEWQIPDPRFTARDISAAIEEAARTIQLVPDKAAS